METHSRPQKTTRKWYWAKAEKRGIERDRKQRGGTEGSEKK